MTDDLRTRIAAVIRSALLEVDYSNAEKSADGEQWVFIDGTVIPENLADAVIRELAWQEEFRIDIGYGGYESEPSREQALERMVEIIEDWGDDPPETGAILQTRYVTEWETDDA